MASKGEEKPELVGSKQGIVSVTKAKHDQIVLVLRVVAFLATASATIVMGLNQETKTLLVGTIGTTPIRATLKAKFQHTPAFVFFVVANGLASVYNLVMLGVDVFGRKLDCKGLRLVIISILDMVIVAVVAAGASSAAFMAELGKNGNSHAKWNKICDKFESFCHQGGGALIPSFIALLLLLLISAISIITLHNQKLTSPHATTP
ncbi:hypothetical protein VitviT2T_015704 [Vitis vinifera]|uniref:CASP-like protein n=1 Tax=Vitis vinifera TaxID=29760 RepID=A0ABY9CSJ5_VITVI|eukprot:XP_002276662.1 PREDICTED: CASP-like protein 1B2 [Vitis vinifera]